MNCDEDSQDKHEFIPIVLSQIITMELSVDLIIFSEGTGRRITHDPHILHQNKVTSFLAKSAGTGVSPLGFVSWSGDKGGTNSAK